MSAAVRPLFDIQDDLLELQTAIIDAGGELTADTEQRLNGVLDELGSKVDAYGFRLRAIQAQIAAHEEREVFHAAQRRAYQRLEQAMKDRLLSVMGSLGQAKLAGADFTARRQESQAVVVADVAAVPDAYWRAVDPVLDKRRALDELKAGKAIPGLQLQTRPYVVIR